MTRKEAREVLMLRKDFHSETAKALDMAIEALSAEAETDGDIGEVSDGYHTFNQLYHQRAVLFATIVKQNKEKAWKSWKHSDGKFCFDSNKEWFIVGVDTPDGSYTYHYKKKYWNMFDCVELEHGKFWDGHTEENVTRLLSLPSAEAEWIPCSERLPEEYAQYLVCLISGECYVYWLEDLDWVRDIVEKEGILAWMPLPTPYKGGDAE